MKGRVRVYDPATAEGWKSEIANAGRPFVPETPLEGPLFVGLEFYFPRPKNHYRTGKMKSVLRDSAPGYHTSKPDADNVIKAVMDALTTLRFWNDDSQVCDVRARKLYDDGRGPGCIISIKELTGSL